MEKYFCNYNQSLALKELGFDEMCFATFDSDKSFDIQDFEQNYDTFPSHIIAAPLKSQVFEWFDKTYFKDENGRFKLRAIIKHKETGYFGLEIRIWRFDNNVGKWGMQSDLKSEQFRGDIESYAIDKLIEIVKDGREIN